MPQSLICLDGRSIRSLATSPMLGVPSTSPMPKAYTAIRRAGVWVMLRRDSAFVCGGRCSYTTIGSPSSTLLDLRLIWLTGHRSSLAHGTPASIASQNYDVPLPEVQDRTGPASSGSSDSTASSFLHLCQLTELLGVLLPMIYSLRRNTKEAWKIVRRTECDLDDWLDALQSSRSIVQEPGSQARGNAGTSCLWFFYLSLKLILNRLAFKVCSP